MLKPDRIFHETNPAISLVIRTTCYELNKTTFNMIYQNTCYIQDCTDVNIAKGSYVSGNVILAQEKSMQY